MLKQQLVLKRQHISKALHKIFDYPLTVVVAAMGYGKSTSVRDFLYEMGANHTWVSVESNEASAQYIWDSLTAQLAKVDPELGNRLRSLGFPADPPQREKILKIIEDATYMRDTVLVLDDYHFVHAEAFDRLIEQIVRARIDGFHLLILSRTIPAFNIDELRLKGYCHMLKNELFELDSEEIKAYFNLYGHAINDDSAKQVCEVTEGWIAAAYLIMQRYAETGRVELGRSIERLIESAVMSRYTDTETMILKSLSVLDSFSPGQAAYVTGIVGTERVIQKLSYGNSFIRYDKQDNVYRIHNIFGNYLLKLLAEQPAGIKLEDLYRRSGQWSINNGDIITGMKYFLKAKEYDLIMKEFEKGTINLVLDNSPHYILELFKQIPEAVKYRHPIGYLAYTGFYVTNVDKEAGARLLWEIEQHYQGNVNISPSMGKCIAGEIKLIRAYVDFNDASLMRDKLKEAHDILEGQSRIANQDKIITFGSPHSLYLYYREKGKLQWTMECVSEMFPYYMEMAGGCGKGFDDLLRAEYCLEKGNLAEAELNAYKAIYKAKTMDQLSVIICAQLTLARTAAAMGNFAEAREIMHDLAAEMETCTRPILLSAFDLCSGYMGAVMGNENSFASWLKSGDIKQSEVLYQGMGFNYIVQGKYLLLKEDFIKLTVLCEEMEQVFSSFSNLLGFLHAYILKAIARCRLYGVEEAGASLIKALNTGRDDKIILPFAEYGPYIVDMLLYLHRAGRKDSYLEEVTAFTLQYTANLQNAADTKQTILALTKREQEILGLVLEGKTNREIAAVLYIAEATVRKNITSIYRKLEVTGRAAAVKKAMELKFI